MNKKVMLLFYMFIAIILYKMSFGMTNVYVKYLVVSISVLVINAIYFIGKKRHINSVNTVNINSIIVLDLLAIEVIIYMILNIEFKTYTTVVLVLIFALLVDVLYFTDKQNRSNLLIILNLVSIILFIIYIYLGMQPHDEPANFGDISLLPSLLFITIFPFFIITHSIVLFRLFSIDVVETN